MEKFPIERKPSELSHKSTFMSEMTTIENVLSFLHEYKTEEYGKSIWHTVDADKVEIGTTYQIKGGTSLEKLKNAIQNAFSQFNDGSIQTKIGIGSEHSMDTIDVTYIYGEPISPTDKYMLKKASTSMIKFLNNLEKELSKLNCVYDEYVGSLKRASTTA